MLPSLLTPENLEDHNMKIRMRCNHNLASITVNDLPEIM